LIVLNKYKILFTEKQKHTSRPQNARSTVTSTTTIAPEEIRERVKRQKHKMDGQKRKLKVKGSANAVRRGRKENVGVVKEYEGWDF
jgi:hypothetical protein